MEKHTFKDFVMNNLPWICGVILGIGLIVGTVTVQGILISDIKDNLKEVRHSMDNYEVRMDALEISVSKIEIYQSNIYDDIKDIKKNLIKKELSKPTSIEITKDTPLEDIEPDFAYMK